MCIVIPLAYRERLVMPKLIINAGGDEFFLPDDNYYFWDDIPSQKYLRLVKCEALAGISELLES